MKEFIHNYFRVGAIQWMSYPVLNGDVILECQFNGPLVGDGLGASGGLHKGQGPAIAIVGKAEKDFSCRHFRDDIIQRRRMLGSGTADIGGP